MTWPQIALGAAFQTDYQTDMGSALPFLYESTFCFLASMVSTGGHQDAGFS